MNKHLRLFLLGLWVSGGAMAAASTTAVAAPDGAPTRTVTYADLDLTKAAGPKVLYRRIHAAAQQVCDFEESRNLEQRAHQQACLDGAIGDAVRHVNSAALNEQRGRYATTQVARN